MPTDNALPCSVVEGLFEPAVVLESPEDEFVPVLVCSNEAFRALVGLDETGLAGQPVDALSMLGAGEVFRRQAALVWRSGLGQAGSLERTNRDGAGELAFRIIALQGSPGRRTLLATFELPGESPPASVTPPADVRSTESGTAAITRLALESIRDLTGADGAALVEHQAGRNPAVTRVGCADAQPMDSGTLQSSMAQPLRRKGGTTGTIEVSATRPDAFGEPEAAVLRLAGILVAEFLDIARNAEDQIRRQRELIDAVPVLISFVDAKRRYVEVNKAYTDWFHQDSAGLRGRHIWEVIGDEAYASIRGHVDRVLNGERVLFNSVVPYRGNPRHVEAHYVPHFDRDHRVQGFFAVVRDVEDRRRADFDQLTTVRSRSSIEAKWLAVHEEAKRGGHPLSVILIDVDHFKQVNDRLGHTVGDGVLKGVAHLVGVNLRVTDYFGRWGGEEFLVLCPDSDKQATTQLAQRLRKAIATNEFPGTTAGMVTASFGVAQMQPGESREALFRRADEALYDAKANGRNRVEVAPDARP